MWGWNCLATRVLRDPVHNLIEINQPEWLLRVLETPEFQRLGRISQLGTSFVTYRGAVHSRLEHSVGVAHVLLRIAANLDHVGASLTEEERAVGLAAALLHDVGHGPFSHALERSLTTKGGHERWTREIVTGDTRVRDILAAVSGDLPEKVADVIAKTSPHRKVVNLISSQMDADRMDYLLRDSLHAGVEYGRFDLGP